MLSVESLLGWSRSRSTGRGPGAGPDAVEEARRIVVETLPRLEESRRLIVALFYFEELTTAEIAQAIGLPAGRVRDCLRETVELLKEAVNSQLSAAPKDAGGAP
jgi:DNA-directed RNA polymerase specialized sigma24 family protein